MAAQAEDINIVLVDPTTQGSSRAEVVLEGTMASSATDATSFRGAVTKGSARVTEATRLSGPTHTLLIFDQSGSFRKHWDRAFDEAGAFADAMGSDHTVEVATFGTGYENHGSADDKVSLRSLLDKARTQGPRDKTTRMHSLVKEGINEVASALPPTRGGLRQVVVFSDLDEEGTFTAQMAIEAARAQGVRVHLVFFASESARHTDNAQRLAESTGGHLVDATHGQSTVAKLQMIATAPARTWWLKLGFCDAPAGQATFQDQLKVEVWGGGSRQGASQAFPFRHAADAVSSKPCVASVTPDPEPAAVEAGFPWWWLLVGALLLGGFLLLLSLPFVVAALTRGRTTEEKPPPPPPEEPSDHAEGNVAPEVFKPVAAGILDRLPPTRLERVQGPSHLPPRLEINRKEMTIGARPDNDLVVDGDTVSGQHASLELFPSGELWVRDRDATNGTWVDGQRLASGERRLLRAGAQLGFGQHLLYRVVQDSVGPSKSDPSPPAPPQPDPQPKTKSRKTTFRPVKG